MSRKDPGMLQLPHKQCSQPPAYSRCQKYLFIFFFLPVFINGLTNELNE